MVNTRASNVNEEKPGGKQNMPPTPEEEAKAKEVAEKQARFKGAVKPILKECLEEIFSSPDEKAKAEAAAKAAKEASEKQRGNASQSNSGSESILDVFDRLIS